MRRRLLLQCHVQRQQQPLIREPAEAGARQGELARVGDGKLRPSYHQHFLAVRQARHDAFDDCSNATGVLRRRCVEKDVISRGSRV